MSVFSQFQPIAVIATTPTAAQKLQPLCQTMGATLYIPESIFQDLENIPNAKTYENSLKEHIASIWYRHKAIIFSLATGAVVRIIAHLIADKSKDPAILVLDGTGKYIIPLCGSHQGGGDKLAQLIAPYLDATPILTGASNSLELPSIDILGITYGWGKGEGDWLGVQTAIAHNQTIQVIQEVGSTLWQKTLPKQHPFSFGFPEYNETTKETLSPAGRIWITATKRRFSTESESIPKIQWHPRVLWVGIGCVRNTPRELIQDAIETTCKRFHLATEAIAGVATIDIKADEVGILELCRDENFPLLTFSAEDLRGIETPNPSEVVNQEVGTPSVAEAAAIQATGNSSLLVSKQIFKCDTESDIKSGNKSGAVTVAIAQSEFEYIDKKGKLYLVGMGPGNLSQMTPAAKAAIASVDVVIGYSIYLDLINPLFRAGQVRESFPITQEKQRAERAIELAKWGLNVAMVSSGDCGIYGMAGLVLELLQLDGWDGNSPEVEVLPGITALNAAAARVGAPMMHDFCGISLSDLLTPWEVILKRLEAAAMADFVTAIYNPKSIKRTQQIVTAREVFLRYRLSSTPVALVRSAFREDESIILTSLDNMLDFSIDMFTTVIIGNSSTRNYSNWMITPRGYQG